MYAFVTHTLIPTFLIFFDLLWWDFSSVFPKSFCSYNKNVFLNVSQSKHFELQKIKKSVATLSCSKPTECLQPQSPDASRGCPCPQTVGPWQTRLPAPGCLPKSPRRPKCEWRRSCSSFASSESSSASSTPCWRFEASSACPTDCPTCRSTLRNFHFRRFRPAAASANDVAATRDAERRSVTFA